MMKTIFEEREELSEARGKAEGKAEEGREMILTFLRAKFQKVPQRIEAAVREMPDVIALKSLAVHVATCQSLEEFEKAIR